MQNQLQEGLKFLFYPQALFLFKGQKHFKVVRIQTGSDILAFSSAVTTLLVQQVSMVIGLRTPVTLSSKGFVSMYLRWHWESSCSHVQSVYLRAPHKYGIFLENNQIFKVPMNYCFNLEPGRFVLEFQTFILKKVLVLRMLLFQEQVWYSYVQKKKTVYAFHDHFQSCTSI